MSAFRVVVVGLQGDGTMNASQGHEVSLHFDLVCFDFEELRQLISDNT